MNYYEVKIYTSTDGLDAVSSVLTMLGHETFMTEDRSVVEELLEKKNSYDWDYVDEKVLAQQYEESKITLYIEPDEYAEAAIEAIRSSISMLKDQDKKGVFGSLRVESSYESDEEWRDKWKEYFKPAKITENIVIKPTWEEYEAMGNEKVIEIDPGMAFGTGTHATTRMCVKHLEKYIESEEDTVLDLGCGSGILSIAAALLGSKHVYGVDIDPNAVTASAENTELNGLSDIIEISYGDVTEGLGMKADIIVANLMADLIIMLAPDIAKHLKGKKIFISSGILEEKLNDVVEAVQNSGFKIIEVLHEEEWCAIAAVLA
jgi:ribosomal protein L11 methyltransferase